MAANLRVQVGSALCRGHLTEPIDLCGMVTGLAEGTDPRLQQMLDLFRLWIAVATLWLLRGLQLVRALQDLLTENSRRHHRLRGLGGSRLMLRRVRLHALQHDQRLHALDLLVLPFDVLEECEVALCQVFTGVLNGALVRAIGTEPGLSTRAVNLLARLIWWQMRGRVAVLHGLLALGGTGGVRKGVSRLCTEAILRNVEWSLIVAFALLPLPNQLG